MRHLSANGMNLLILALVVVAGIVGWGVKSFREPGPAAEAVVVEVPRGAGLEAISRRLAEAGAIGNAAIFRLGVRYLGVGDRLKFGVYEIPAGASMQEIVALLEEGGAEARFRVTFGLGLRGVGVRMVDLLKADAPPVTGPLADPATVAAIEAAVTSGSSLDFRVTVPEGLTSWQIVEGLKAIPYLDGDVAEVPAEGVLAPDTYAFRRGGRRQAILDAMAAAQARILVRAWEGRAPDLPLKSAEEALVLASLVEKETGVAAERPVVASVFINRLRKGMRLETDPAVIYGLTLGREVLDRGLRQSELQRRTPWNTYVIPGLPPTPIANPGRAAIEAVLNPADTPYLFFVADGTGGHAFAETLREHQANVARWRAIEAERSGD